MARIELAQVGKTYPDGTVAVRDVELSVEHGEFMVLVGPSGCGKSTLLRMIAGLEGVTDGALSIDGRVVNGVPPQERDIAMIFQNYALYPHMTTAENIGFGLRLQKIPKAERAARVHDVAVMLDIVDCLAKKPRSLSGGQRQRVAMGRAIIRHPSAFLMDEPLSNLDAKLRVQMRSELIELHARLGVTTVYVTHDQVEAMTMGDRVAVLSTVGAAQGSNLQQVGTPRELYETPASLFVAGFIGSPAMNFINTSLGLHEGEALLDLGEDRLRVPRDVLASRPALLNHRGKELIVGFRPDDLSLRKAPDDDQLVVTGTAEVIQYLGSSVLITFRKAVATTNSFAASGTAHTDVGRGRLLAQVEADRLVKTDERVEFYLRPDRLHFFDPQSGLALR